MFGKQEVKAFLEEKNIPFEWVEHKAVYTIEEMEELGLLERKIYPQIPPKVEYTLTDIGYSLRPVLESLKGWGKDYKRYTKLLERMRG